MQTTGMNEDMFADFFQVGGYSNISGIANVTSGMVKGGGQGIAKQKLSALALRGGSGVMGIAFGQFSKIFRQTKEMTGLSTNQIDELWLDFNLEGNKNIKDFPDWAMERSGKGEDFKKQIIADVEEVDNIQVNMEQDIQQEED